MRWLVLLLLVVVLAMFGLRYLPPEWDPRTPLNLTAPPNLLTSLKLRWMTVEPQACFAAFAASGLPVSPVPDRPSDQGCAIEHAVRLTGSVRATPPGPIVTCPLAAAWVLYERNALQPVAKQYLGTEVIGIRHLGSYACRNVNHEVAGQRSEHATANALDVAAFILRDGRDVSVARNWSGDGPEARFLHAARDGACRWFRTALSPDYNAVHRDHFHFDMGPWRVCR